MGSRHRDDGTVVVEFALLLPVLFLVLLAAVQVGVLVRDQLVLTQAARAGAREAAVTLDEGVVRAAVERAASGLDGASLGMSVTREGSQGAPVTVGVSYSVDVVGPLAGWLLPATVLLEASATMRQEVP